MPTHQFININNPEETRSRRYLWNVRSHASRISRSPARASRAETEQKRNKAGPAKKTSPKSEAATKRGSKSPEIQDVEDQEPLRYLQEEVISSPTTATFYDQYSSQYSSYFPTALHYFIANFAWSVSYLNLPSQRGHEQSLWWPRPSQHPALFLGQMLSALQSINKMCAETIIEPLDLLALRGDTLGAINDLLGSPETSESPATLAAIVHMTFTEYFHGDFGTFDMHLAGLKHMLEMEGVRSRLLADVYLRKATRLCLFLESSKLRHQQRIDGTPAEFYHPVDGTIAVNPQTPRMKSIKRVAALLMDSLLLFNDLASPAHCRLMQLCIPIAELAILLLDTEESERDREVFKLESLFIMTNIDDFGFPFRSDESNDAYAPDSQSYDIAGECVRFCMTGTLYRIMTVAGLDPASLLPCLQELRENAVHLASMVEDTEYHPVVSWARYVFAESKAAAP